MSKHLGSYAANVTAAKTAESSSGVIHLIVFVVLATNLALLDLNVLLRNNLMLLYLIKKLKSSICIGNKFDIVGTPVPDSFVTGNWN